MRLTPDTDREAMAAHVEGADRRRSLRRSQVRADRLQRNARIRTREWGLSVEIEPDHPPARLGSGDSGPEIVISGDAVPQPVTDYPAVEWDLLVQTVWVMHEVGHLTHTDFRDLESRLSEVREGWKPVAGHIWNAFEDVAVEAAIRDRWPNYGWWFDQVRANLLAGSGPGIADPAGGTVYPMVHAIVLGGLDSIWTDQSLLRTLLDPAEHTHHFATEGDRERFQESVLPALASTIEAVTSMPDAVDRNRRVFEFVEAVRPEIEAARADGRGQVAAISGDAWGMPDDALLSQSQNQDPEPIEVLSGGLPAATGTDGPRRPRHPKPNSLEWTAEIVPDADETDEDDDARDAGSAEEPMDDHPLETRQLSDSLSAEIVEQERRDSTERDAHVENLEDLQAAVEAAEADLESDGVILPTDNPVADAATARAAREDGTRLARVLRNRFQKLRKRDVNRNLRRGRLDPSAIHRHATGERRLKHRRETPEEPSHHCLFVLDRSGSMRQVIRVAERAMGMLVFALEAVDVDVGVLELLDKEVRLAKATDQDAERVEHRLFHGEASGGTPLTDTLHIARERLKREEGNRFLFVVTDGLPSDPDRYREALNRFPVPVVGVNLTTDTAAGESEFHRQVTVAPETDELRRALRQLVQEVLFE